MTGLWVGDYCSFSEGARIAVREKLGSESIFCSAKKPGASRIQFILGKNAL